MASIEQLQQALINADKAGDTAAATALAQALKQANAAAAAPKQDVPQRGMLLPVTRDASGLHFDINSGITGAAIDAFKLPGDVFAGRARPDDTARNMNFAAFATGTPPTWLRRTPVPVPTGKALRDAGGAGFDAAREMGVAYTPQSIATLADTAQQKLLQDGLGPEVAGKTNAILDKLKTPPADPSAQFDYTNGVAAVKANLQSIAQDWTSPKDQLAATRAIKALDEFVAKPGPQDVLAGPAAALGSVVKDANANYAAGSRANTLADISKRAQDRASASGSGLNLDNSIRGRVATFIANPANTAGFTKSEIALLQGVVDGTKPVNTLRWFGNYLGGGGGLGAALTGFGATALTNDPRLLFAAVPAAVGLSAKMAENAATKNALNNIIKTTSQRSPLYADKAAQAPLKPTTPADRAKIIQMMMTGIPGVSPGLPAPRSGNYQDAQGRWHDAQGNLIT